MNMYQYLLGKHLTDGKTGYWAILKILVIGLWIMLTSPPQFEADGQMVQNGAPNGALRTVLGGVSMALLGLVITGIGLLTVVLILCILPMCPLGAIYIMVLSRIRAKREIKDLEAQVKAAREAAHNGS